MTREAPLIAIVGRPNVGKSTLFNRLVGGRPALVHDTPGLTRDRRYGELEYFGHHLRVVDTGGLDPEAESHVIGAGIHRQAWAAIEESDAVLFVVDATAGVTGLDQEVAAMLRTRVTQPVLVCANKVDNWSREALAADVYSLGLGDVFPVSAVHGRGVDELLERLVERLELPPPVWAPAEGAEEDRNRYQSKRAKRRAAAAARWAEGGGAAAGAAEDEAYEDEADEADAYEDEAYETDAEATEAEDTHARATSRPAAARGAAHAQAAPEPAAPLRVAFLGKPNAGKSSLLNRLVGTERSLVHDQPGTTMDPVDTPFEFGGRSYVLVDTAGIRRRARIEAETERIAVSMALSQVERADVVVLVIDGSEGPSEQDGRLVRSIEEQGRALVIALNKADLLEGQGASKALKEKVRDQLHFVQYAPVVMISALRGDGVANLMSVVDRVAKQHARRIATSELNRFFAEVCETHPPPLYHGHAVRVHYLTQGAVRPPTFILWANRPEGMSPAYRRYVLNQLRQRYRFEGTPLRLIVKAKKRTIPRRQERPKQPPRPRSKRW